MMNAADIHDPAQKAYVDFAREIDAYIAEKYPKLASRRVVATEDSMEKLLVTSDGADSHFIAPRSYLYVILSAETDAGAPVELFKAFGGRGTFDIQFTDPSALHDGIGVETVVFRVGNGKPDVLHGVFPVLHGAAPLLPLPRDAVEDVQEGT